MYNDASDYAHGAYLCQVQIQPDGSLTEHPIRFLNGTLAVPQIRWSTIEKDAYDIYWAFKKLDDLLGRIRFTIRTDHRNLLYLNTMETFYSGRSTYSTMMLSSNFSRTKRFQRHQR